MEIIDRFKGFIEKMKTERIEREIEKAELEFYKMLEKEQDKIFSTIEEIANDTKQIFGKEAKKEIVEDFLEIQHYKMVSKNMPNASELEILKSIKEKGLENSILEVYKDYPQDQVKAKHSRALSGEIPLSELKLIEEERSLEALKRRYEAEYKLFEKTPILEEMRKQEGNSLLMFDSWREDKGGKVFNVSLSEDQYQLLFYGQIDKALQNGKDFEGIKDTIQKGGLNALCQENGLTQAGFRKHCQDFISQQKALGEKIEYPKILEEPKQEPKQKRVSPQVRAEQEKKAQKQGRGR